LSQQSIQYSPDLGASVRTLLAGDTFADRVYFRPQVDSTNAWARSESGRRALPAIYLTDHQTAGRGRLGRAWEDDAGQNVLVSIMLPAPSGRHRSLVPILAGVAVCRAVESCFPSMSLQLKWPNDILVGGRKVGGILAELVAATNDPTVIVGIGLNANQTSFPCDLRHPATSLHRETGHPVDRAPVVAAIIHNMVRDSEVSETDLQARLDEYRHRLSGIGARVRLTRNLDQEAVDGVLLGVDASGALQLATDCGIRTFSAGDVTTFRGPECSD
jgi:BirA family transcriptional regulator, biotin operon repressor / biotin---[acetyl-CoA-carboxylase] ligase